MAEPFSPQQRNPCTNTSNKDVLDHFITRVEAEFRTPLQTPLLRQSSLRLQEQFHEKLKQSDICMLPSYSEALPSGNETGEYLALDLGGSFLRIARVRLHGRDAGKHGASEIRRQWSFPITERARNLSGIRFFDWIARQIWSCMRDEVRDGEREPMGHHQMGVAWSFPLDHTSPDSAKILQMGKAFRAAEGLIGADLGELLEEACARESITIKVRGIVNDGSASLLSQMYIDDSATMAVILGTGLNAAVHLPATAFSTRKFASSAPGSPIISATPNVLVNTELSMFGKNAIDTNAWDETLNLAHPRPDFQPLEHLTSGRYLGELVRLIVLKACEQANLFGGEVPHKFDAYELETSTIAAVESEAEPDTPSMFRDVHPLPSGNSYTEADMEATRRIVLCVSDRASAFLATAIHALWTLKRTSAETCPGQEQCTITISCLGSILGKYPRFRERVQMWLDKLTQGETCQMRLESDGGEGPLIGAAIASALLSNGKDG